MLRQLIWFGGIGWLATLVHISAAIALQSFLEMLPLQANFGGFCVALAVSYFGHAHFTFDSDPRHTPKFIRFLVIALAGLTTSSAIVWLVNGQLGVTFGIAMVTVAVAIPIMTFSALRLWVFANQGQSRADCRHFVIPAAIFVVTTLIFWGRAINHDTAWYLLATRQWLAGKVLYVDLIEVNPPLNFYLTVPSLALADLLQVGDANGQNLWLALLIFVSLTWCSVIMKGERGMSEGVRNIGLLGIGTAMVLPALDNMGQRDQLLVILMMPWIFGHIVHCPATLGSRIARAAFAALGVCLKPHFVVFPIIAMLFESARRRSVWPIFSASSMTFLAMGSAYVLLVANFHPAYFDEIVPLAHEVYGGYRAHTVDVALKVRNEMLILLALALIALIDLQRQWPIAFLALMSLSGLASYLMQGTGFGYHKIPLVAFLLTTCVWILVRIDRKLITALTCALTLGLMTLQISRGFYQNPAMADWARARIDWTKVKSVFIFTPHVYAGPGVAFGIGTSWSSRYPANWLVPGAVNRLRKLDCGSAQDTCARLSAIAARNRTDNIVDIQRNKPVVLVIDKQSGYFDVHHFDWLQFMAQDAAWPTVIGHYRLIESGERFDYYMRRESPPESH